MTSDPRTDAGGVWRSHASHWGTFTAMAGRDGSLEVAPVAGDPAPSDLLRSLPSAVRHATRIAEPAVRTGWLRGDGGRGRGADSYVAVEWERALDLVASEIRRIRDDVGNPAIFAGSYGWASAGRYHHPKTHLNRLLSLVGGYTGHVGTYSFGASSVILPHVLGSADPGAGGVSSWDGIVEHTELIVAFGGLPRRCDQVNPGGMGVHTTAGWLARLVERQVEIIGISPLRGDIPAEPDARWWPAVPGTDVALMLALMHTLLVEGLYDRAFVERCCAGMDLLAAYVLGRTDGQPKSPDWAAPITGIASEEIAGLARRLTRRRTLITATWALQRAQNGEQTYWAVVALAALIGQIGLPGGGFGFAYGIGNKGEPESPVRGPTMPRVVNPAESAIPVARIADMLLAPGGRYAFDGEERTYPDTRMVYWAGGNPFHHHQDLNRLARAWKRPETVVVQDPFWTATARQADIVLPATTSLERNDIGYGNRDRFIVAMRQVLQPVGQARDDVEIFAELAGRLGVREAFTEGRDEMSWLRWLYDGARAAAVESGFDLCEFDEFWAKGQVELPCPESPRVLFAKFRADPDTHRLATPSGRIQLASAVIGSYGYAECPGVPAWIEPSEWLGSIRARTFPLHLITYQPGSRLHSQLDQGVLSGQTKVAGREPCRINDEDAERRGISSGDVVRLFNGRGACLAGAVVSADIRPGVVAMATGAWYDPVDWMVPGSLEKHGNPNVLTSDRGTSRLAQACSAQTTLVDVERFAGDAPPVTAHVPPAVERRR